MNIQMSEHAVWQAQHRNCAVPDVLQTVVRYQEDIARHVGQPRVQVVVKRLASAVRAHCSTGDTVVASVDPATGIIHTVMLAERKYLMRKQAQGVPVLNLEEHVSTA